MKVALVHDWLVAHRGGENVLLEFARFFPDAPIFTLVHEPGSAHPELEAHPIHTSFIQNLPGAPRRFRQYLPLFPSAIERFDLAGFDLVLSTSHSVAKGVHTGTGQQHVSYIHTPMRYLWDQMPQYFPSGLPGRLAAALLEPLRRWDVRSAVRPDVLIANSRFVAERITRVWGRDAQIIYPPVDVDFYCAGEDGPGREGYLVVSALVSYKRVDLAVRAATQENLPLKVIGYGAEGGQLRSIAGPTVEFLGWVTDRTLIRAAYRRARALLFCGVEDFGIVPVEAMAAGCPVIALGEGGALETVVDDGVHSTGVFFKEQSVAGVLSGIEQLENRRAAGQFTVDTLGRQARRFHTGEFIRRMRHFCR